MIEVCKKHGQEDCVVVYDYPIHRECPICVSEEDEDQAGENEALEKENRRLEKEVEVLKGKINKLEVEIVELSSSTGMNEVLEDL